MAQMNPLITSLASYSRTNMKTIVSTLVTVLGLLFFGQPSRAVDLSDLISTLYGGDGITLGATGHQAHFSQETGSAINELNRQLGTAFGVFPFSSSAGNFGFKFDPDLGTFVNTTETLGPIFAERAPTVGRGKWNLNFYATFFHYDDFNGQSLDNLQVVSRHDPDEITGPDPDGIPGVRSGYQLDTLDVMVDLDAAGMEDAAGSAYFVCHFRLQLDP
jgi:hypothetical protein